MRITDEQFGYMPRKSTTDGIFALRRITVKYGEGQKGREICYIL